MIGKYRYFYTLIKKHELKHVEEKDTNEKRHFKLDILQ